MNPKSIRESQEIKHFVIMQNLYHLGFRPRFIFGLIGNERIIALTLRCITAESSLLCPYSPLPLGMPTGIGYLKMISTVFILQETVEGFLSHTLRIKRVAVLF